MDKFEELKAYKELLDSNIITQEEFDKKKKELLSYNTPITEISPKVTDLSDKSQNENSLDESKKRSLPALSQRTIILFVILLVVAGIGVGVLIKKNEKKGKKSSSASSGSSYSYEIDYSTYCLLYLKVSNVSVSHSGNYAYVSGTITNNGTSSIRYVKVKAACKNASGKIIDTDWTYAVDSSWLDPGESKNFEMMVKDTSKEIRTASVTVEY